MRKYDIDDERKIRTERLVREWTRSSLLDQAQHAHISDELKTNLRRTNFFLRVVLFAFGFLIIAASVALIAVTSRIYNDAAVGVLFLFAAAAAFGAAEFLIGEFRLYRFGAEEAAGSISAVLVVLAIVVFASSLHNRTPVEFVAAIAGAIAAFVVYLRFGYLYAALASMACVLIAPFQLHLSGMMQRSTSAVTLLGVFAIARFIYFETKDEYPGDECAVIQAAAWAGAYAVLNLHIPSLTSFMGFAPHLDVPVAFSVLTYVLIWLLPATGLYLSLRDRNRALLDTNLVLALVTLSTNKPYLGATRQTWDPILLGLLLIGTAYAARRWLSTGKNGARHGFTATRLLSSDKRRLSMIGTASAALHTGPAGTHETAPNEFEGGGGRSGGAGASGGF